MLVCVKPKKILYKIWYWWYKEGHHCSGDVQKRFSPHWMGFIHSNIISCSLIGSLVNMRSVLKMHNALCVLCRDCAWSFVAWSRHVRDCHIDWSIFSLGKVLIFFMFIAFLCFKPNFYKHEQMIFFFCRILVRWVHWTSINIQRVCTGFELFLSQKLTHLLTYMIVCVPC